MPFVPDSTPGFVPDSTPGFVPDRPAPSAPMTDLMALPPGATLASESLPEGLTGEARMASKYNIQLRQLDRHYDAIKGLIGDNDPKRLEAAYNDWMAERKKVRDEAKANGIDLPLTDNEADQARNEQTTMTAADAATLSIPKAAVPVMRGLSSAGNAVAAPENIPFLAVPPAASSLVGKAFMTQLVPQAAAQLGQGAGKLSAGDVAGGVEDLTAAGALSAPMAIDHFTSKDSKQAVLSKELARQLEQAPMDGADLSAPTSQTHDAIPPRTELKISDLPTTQAAADALVWSTPESPKATVEGLGATKPAADEATPVVPADPSGELSSAPTNLSENSSKLTVGEAPPVVDSAVQPATLPASQPSSAETITGSPSGNERQGSAMPADRKPRPSSTTEPSDPSEIQNSSQVAPPVTTAEKPQIVGMGGAVPSEFEHNPQTSTSIKNASVDAERQKRGLPPAMQAARKDFGAVWDEAMAKIDRDPEVIKQLVDELRQKPRALTDTEDATLLYHQIDLQNEYGKATRDLAQAYDDGRLEDVEREKARVASFSDQLLDLYNIGKKAGTETGRGLNARKMAAFEDFSLAHLTMEKRALNGGRPLTEEETAAVQKVHDEYEAKLKALNEHAAQADQRNAELESKLAHAQMLAEAQPKANPYVIKMAERIVSLLDERADKARKRLAGKLFSVSPDVLLDLAEIGASHIGHVGLEFTKWSAAMVSELGDRIKPHLQEVWEASQKVIDSQSDKLTGKNEAVKRSVKKMDETERFHATVDRIGKRLQDGQINNIGPLVQQLARHFVSKGIKERNTLIDAVHGILQGLDPEFTRRQTMDAISGYGQFSQLSQDQISVQLRDLKGQMQQVAKLEDMQAGHAPQKTGVERRSPSDEERRLISQVNEAKKKGGFTVTDPATQLRSALQSVKARLANQIKDLEHQIATRQRIVKQRAGLHYDEEAKALQVRRDALKAEFDGIFGQREMTSEQRVKLAMASVKRSIADYERRIKEKDLSPQNRESKTPLTPELEAARARRDALKDQLQELRELANPKATPEQRALAAYKTRTRNRIAELQKRLAQGDFSKRERKPLPLDQEGLKLKADLERVKQQWQTGLLKDRLSKRSWYEKVGDFINKWNRAFILSGPATLGKLTAAASERMLLTPAEEAVGAGYSMLYPKLAARAPREGGVNVQAEAKAWSGLITGIMKDSWENVHNRPSELELAYDSRRHLIPHDASEFFGMLHGALKAPVKRAEFSRSLEKRMAHAIANGVDVSDPLVQMKLSLDAYKDGKAAILMQDNRLVSAIKSGIANLERPDKATGQVPLAGKVAAVLSRLLVPILKIPTNYVSETYVSAAGLVSGHVKLAQAIKSGVENLKPEEADQILRHLKKGSLGAALILLGYYNPQAVGGYYQQGEHRKKSDVKEGGLRVFDHDIPRLLVHNPLLECLQIGSTVRRVADSKLRKKDKENQGVFKGAEESFLGLTAEVPLLNEALRLSKYWNRYERESFKGELARSFLEPQLVQYIAQQMDKDASGNLIARKPVTVPQYIESGLPGLRQDVPRKK